MRYSFGKVSYINVEPLFARGDSQDFEFFPDVPSRLNIAAENGRFDTAILSMWIYPKLYKTYKLVPQYGVFGDGKIMSVMLFSRFPIEELGGKKIFLTSESGSSVRAFAKLCSEKYGFNPFDNRTDSKKDADAIFLIGNSALICGENNPNLGYSYDLGELWKNYYRTPIAYAGVVVKRNLYDALLPKIRSYFDASLAEFFANKKAGVARAAKKFVEKEGQKISEKTLEEYYDRLIFKLSEEDYFKSVRIALDGRDFG